MNVIIPVAGRGERLRPLTDTTPKPLLEVAGKPILDHIMDKILPLNPSEVIFVTGHLKEQIEEYAKKFPNARCIEQQEQRGTADAVWTAKDALTEDVLVDFGDTIFDADLSVIENCQDDAIIWVKEVDNPERFGVIVTDDQGYMTTMVEKPKEFVSNLANIGLYYIKNHELFKGAVQHTIEHHEGKGEMYLTDAFQYMVDKGANIKPLPVKGWYDCGTKEDLEKTDTILRTRNS
ncbi:MAG: nucleotidyltransferase family protein [Candidatus Woesearchaeota archaeon]|nr:nucleotidyltransferase family protein [Candidatus Woesearchaeota archaeon]